MKTKLSYEACHIYVEGTEMNCPLCKVLVKSGETHNCNKPAAKQIRKAAGPAQAEKGSGKP